MSTVINWRAGRIIHQQTRHEIFKTFVDVMRVVGLTAIVMLVSVGIALAAWMLWLGLT